MTPTTSFLGLNIGLSALKAHQRSLETISHNIANVNTEGYSRQEVALTSSWTPTGQIFKPEYVGTGVNSEQVRRYASRFLTDQIRMAANEEERWATLHDTLAQIQVIFHEPAEEGLGAALDEFWAAWQDVGTDPTNFSQRARLREVAEQIAEAIRQKYQELMQLQRELAEQVKSTVRQINDLATRVAELDKRIRQGRTLGAVPNDLMDQRDQLLYELGKLVDITTAYRDDGGVMVTVNGHLLVSERGAHLLNEDSQPSWQLDGAPLEAHGGQIAGLFASRDEEVPRYLDQLHEIASALINAVNDLHRQGYNLNGTTGLDFFVGSDASDIAVSPEIIDDPNNIAAAELPDAPGDGNMAFRIADVAHELLTSSHVPLGTFYNTMIAMIGMGVRQTEAQQRNQEVLLQHLWERRDALSGVSVDEEAVKMVGAQRAYEAAARVITAVDEMLDRLINDTGLVGR